jgi:8-oxo-dGTP diphosphatase
MIEVVAAIIKMKDKYLCCQRKKNKLSYLSEKYEFPGGKIEKNETKEEALKREIKEELGLKINIEKFFQTIMHSYPDFDLTMHCYLCTLDEFNIKLNEHISYKLLKPEKLHTIDWVLADIEIVNLLKEQNGI